MSTNPYITPTSVQASQELDRHPATKLRRFTTFAIDYFGVVVLWFAILLILETLWLEFARYDFHTEEPPSFPPQYDKNICAAIATTATALISGLYFVFAEWTSGKTIGKLLTRTLVVDQFGHAPSFRKLVKRTALRYVPWDIFTFLLGTNNGWHDKYSETTVIQTQPRSAR